MIARSFNGMHVMCAWFRCVPALVLLFGLPAVAMADCVFVNTNSVPNSVAALWVNRDGSLISVPGSPFPTGGSGGFTAAVGSIGLSAGTGFVYATNTTTDNVSVFSISMDCRLTAVPGSPFDAGSSPVGVEPDPSGAHLYVSNFDSHDITVYSIAGDGSLTPIAGSPFPAATTPLDLKFNPDGSLLFVSQTSISAVGVYDILPAGGISPLVASPFLADGFVQGLSLTSGGSYLYAAGRNVAGTITGFSVLPSGALFELPGSPFPATDPVEVLIDPADRFLYLTNNLASTIAIDRISADGSLTPVPGSPFPSDSTFPAGMTLNTGVPFPAPRILYVANGGFLSGSDVSAFAIFENGSAAPLPSSPFATGGIGQATGIEYYRNPALVREIPTLDQLSFFVLILSLAVAGLLSFRRS
jgi:6-phosphogluconolactonase (cycloisomerase 2 family)